MGLKKLIVNKFVKKKKRLAGFDKKRKAIWALYTKNIVQIKILCSLTTRKGKVKMELKLILN
jgi:hypothetical protein